MKNELRENKMLGCNEFFDALAEALKKHGYVIVGSCNRDTSRYLVLEGTEDQITYESKPAFSFRVSDHWNWYAKTSKCPDRNYVQCYSVDLPLPEERAEDSNKPTNPRWAAQVAVSDKNGIYHIVYGEKFNHRNKKWSWVQQPVSKVVSYILNREVRK